MLKKLLGTNYNPFDFIREKVQMNKARKVHHQMLDLFQRVRCLVSKKFSWISWTTMRLWLVSLPVYLLVLMFIMILFKIFRRFWLGLIPRLFNFLHNLWALPIILKMHAVCFWSDGMMIIKCRRASRRIRPCNGLLPQYTIANLVFRHLRGSLAVLVWVNSKKGRKSTRLSVDEVLTKTNAR